MSQNKRKTYESNGYPENKHKKMKDSGFSHQSSQHELIMNQKFERIDILGDGNCLFRAILCCLIGDDSGHMDLRNDICDHILENRNQYANFIYDQNIEDYIKKMRKDGVWGDHLELVVASTILRFNFVVYKSKKC